jgi:hypothetical protein
MKRLIFGALILLFLFPSNSFGYTILKTFHKTEYGPGGLAYDEVTDTLWASDLITKIIWNIDPNTGGIITAIGVGYNSLPTGLTYKDGYLWNSDQWAAPEVIHKVNPVSGSSEQTIPGLGGLTFDHLGRLWSTDWYIELRALDPDNGAILDTITLPGFDPSGDDQIMGMAFDNYTETLWVSVVEDRWNPPAQNWLLSVALDGTVLSTEEFDPDPALDGYELGGLAFDNNSGTLWANYSLFDRPPTSDDTYIYELSGDSLPVIEKIKPRKGATNPREPGTVVRIIGSGFGDLQGNSEVHIGPKTYGPDHRKIKDWSDNRIKVKLPKYKCEWFKGQDYRKRRIWVTVDGVDSNKKTTKVFKPGTCQ